MGRKYREKRFQFINIEDGLSKPGDVLKTEFMNAVRLVQDSGIQTFLFRILPWHFFRRFTVYSQALTSQVRVGPYSGRADLRIEMATEKNLSHIMGLRPLFYRRGQLMKRFQERHLCFIGWIGDDPVHIRWHFKNSRYLPYIKRRVMLSSRDIWSDEAYTHPGYRRRGIYASAAVQTNGILAELGYRNIFCAVASWNSSSLRSVLKRGMQPVGEIDYRNIFLFRKYKFSGSIRELKGDRIGVGDQC